MEELLKSLLNRLEHIGKTHQEIYDTECRERMSGAVFDGFIKPGQGFELPEDLGLYSAEANKMVREALRAFLVKANNLAQDLGVNSFHDRLAMFQNQSVRTDDERLFYDDFFGYWQPKSFSELGEIIE